ncbi:MAG: restriction endonuclease subunit S [Candidatus Thiodiazotropha sp. (ex Troendleina suluensis)]|nr:restriction endonuclease subunit S [Candidatus Thiodiazotropha sp. (ex Troendleina suluensis)]
MRNDAEYMRVRLGDVADIRSGYPFRGAVPEITDGDAAVVQIKNVDTEAGIDWTGLVQTELTGRRKPDWLQSRDILFTARGNRNIAVYVDSAPVNAVCAPQFFLVRLKSDQQALPQFVAWQINQPNAQKYFAQSAEGTLITSIRRKVLEEMPLHLPSGEKQELVVRLCEAAQHEKNLLTELIENRKKQLNVVTKNLLG